MITEKVSALPEKNRQLCAFKSLRTILLGSINVVISVGMVACMDVVWIVVTMCMDDKVQAKSE